MTGTAFDDIPAPPCSQLLGWRLIAHDAEKGWIRIGFEGKPEFLNPAGLIQGGIQGAMLDDTMGPAVWIKTGGSLYTATIEMNLSFLAPVRPGPLFAEGTVLQLGSTIAFLEGKLLDAGGTVLTRATACARLLRTERALGGRREPPPANDSRARDTP